MGFNSAFKGLTGNATLVIPLRDENHLWNSTAVDYKIKEFLLHNRKTTMGAVCLLKTEVNRHFTFYSKTKCRAIISAEQAVHLQLHTATAVKLRPFLVLPNKGGARAGPVLWLRKLSMQKVRDIRVSNKENHHFYCQQVINKYMKVLIMQPCPQVEKVN